MANNVFERREKKYLVDPEQRIAVECAAIPYLAPDAFGCTLITSVYLDTPERSLIAHSLEKPLYKEKLRLRAYGDHASEALLMLCRDGMRKTQAIYGDELLAMPVFVELKKKFDGIVYKRRIRLSLPAAWAFTQGASYEAACATYPLIEAPAEDLIAPEPNLALDRQIAHELEAAFGRYENLRPSCAILCRRTAWAPREGEEGPRITFDENLSFLDLFDAATTVQPIIAPTVAVMEVKAGVAMPSWLIATLSQEKNYPQSFSKYGEAAKTIKNARAGAEGRGASRYPQSNIVIPSGGARRGGSGFPRSSVALHGSRRNNPARSDPSHPASHRRPKTFTLLKKEA